MSQPTIEKMRLGHTGKVHLLSTKTKISTTMKGRPRNSDACKKSSEALVESWANRRCGGVWYGGVIYNDRPQYCERFTEEFKERVRAYWGYKCFECDIPQNGVKLPIHHVHYDKKMCCNGSPHDVVPLCPSCHSQTNHHRDYWEKHFTDLIYLYNPKGKCFLTKEEMKIYRTC